MAEENTQKSKEEKEAEEKGVNKSGFLRWLGKNIQNARHVEIDI